MKFIVRIYALPKSLVYIFLNLKLKYFVKHSPTLELLFGILYSMV